MSSNRTIIHITRPPNDAETCRYTAKEKATFKKRASPESIKQAVKKDPINLVDFEQKLSQILKKRPGKEPLRTSNQIDAG